MYWNTMAVKAKKTVKKTEEKSSAKKLATKKKAVKKTIVRKPVKKTIVRKPVKKTPVKKTIKKTSSKEKVVSKIIAPRPVSITTTVSDKAPDFFSVDDRNFRNNFGYPMKEKRDINSELNLIDQRMRILSKANEGIKDYSSQKNPSGIAVKIITAGIVFVALMVLVLSIFMLIGARDIPLEEGIEGICSVKLQTYDTGDKETAYTQLPDTSCSTKADCKSELINSGFAEDDVNKMSLKCEEKIN